MNPCTKLNTHVNGCEMVSFAWNAFKKKTDIQIENYMKCDE